MKLSQERCLGIPIVRSTGSSLSEQIMVSSQFERATQSETRTSNIPDQLHNNYIGISLQFIALRGRCDLSGNRPLWLSRYKLQVSPLKDHFCNHCNYKKTKPYMEDFTNSSCMLREKLNALVGDICYSIQSLL